MSDFGWMKWDICFCNEDCANIKCYRNYKHIPKEEQMKPHTYSMLRDIDGECEGYMSPVSMIMCDKKEKDNE